MPAANSLLRNTASTYAAFAIQFVLRLFLIRLILSKLGLDLLGIWGVLKAVVLWPLFVQQAIAGALFLQVARERNSSDGRPYLALSIGFTLCASVIAFIFSPAIVSFFNVPAENANMTLSAFRLLIITLLCSSVSVLYYAIWQGLARFDISFLIQTLFSLFNTGIAIVLLFSGYGILSLIVLDAVTSVLILLVSIFVQKGIAPEIPLWGATQLQKIRSALKKSTGQLAFGGLGRLLWELDAILIPRFFGISLMASYWIGRRLPVAWGDFVWGGVWPSVPEIAKDEEQNRATNIHWLQISMAIPVAVFFWRFSDSIIYFWTGRYDAIAAMIMKILVVGIAVEFLPATFVSLFFSRGLVAPVVSALLFGVVMKGVIAGFAYRFQSWEMLVAGTTAGAIAFAACIFTLVTRRLGHPWIKSLMPILLSAMASGIALAVSYLAPPPQSLIGLLTQAGLFFGISAPLTIALIRFFSPEVYRRGTRFAWELFSRSS